jgi:hypothetical protein
VQRGQAVRVGKVEIQQHAVELGAGAADGVGERLCAHDVDVGARDGEQLLDQDRVAVVVLDEQDVQRWSGRPVGTRSCVGGHRWAHSDRGTLPTSPGDQSQV